MTDTYSADPNVVDFKEQQRRRVSAVVMDSFDQNPDEAARAQQIGAATGTPSSIIGMDSKGYEDNFKRITASQLVTNDDTLSDFVTRHPEAAAVAQDDWDNLSDYAEALLNVGYKGAFKAGEQPPKYAPPITPYTFWNAGKAAIEGFNEAYGSGPDVLAPYRTEDGKIIDKQTLTQYVAQAATSAAERPVIGALLSLPWNLAYGALSVGPKSMAALGALSEAVNQGGLQFAIDSGLDPYEAKRFAREAASFVEFELTDMARSKMHGPEAKQFKEDYPGVDPRMAESARLEGLTREAQQALAPLMVTTRLMKPYIEAGMEPPKGLHPLLDLVIQEAEKREIESLEKADQAGNKVQIKDRSPITFDQFTRGVLGERHVYVDADIARQNVEALDWVPELQQQLQDEGPSGRVRIPLEDWNKADPEIKKLFKDDYSIHSDGNTTNDWNEIPPGRASEYVEDWTDNSNSTRTWDAVTSLRRANKLEPLGGMPSEVPKRLQLVRGKPVPYPELKGEHSFMITDEIGRHVADLEIDTRDGGKDLHVKWLGGRYVPHQQIQPVTNIFGPTLMRDLFRQIRDEFPDAETISGRRVSGAREGTIKEGGEIKVNIDALRAEVEDPAVFGEHAANFMDIAESGDWAKTGAGGEYLPLFRDNLPVHAQKIADDIEKVFARLLPKEMEGRAFATKRVLLDGRDVRGYYQPYYDRMPLITWSLTYGHPGVARHEAMHFLKAYGYISDEEWGILIQAAEKGNWIEKHDIDRMYPGESLSNRLEEAIAKELEDWSKDKPATAYSGVFGRIRKLLEELHDYFKEVLFGKEPTPENIFQKIERGTVAERPMGEVETPTYDPRTVQVAGPLPAGMAARLRGPRAPELPGMRPLEERAVHEPGALLPKRRQEMMEKEIKAETARDLEFRRKQAAEDVKEQATKEYQDEAASRLPKIEEEVANMPGFAIDTFFREGKIQGQELDKKPKIRSDMIPPEYESVVPTAWRAKKGESPDVLAGLFGQADATEFFERIAEHQLSRGEMTQKAFFKKSVGIKLTREMEREFGKQGDAVMKAAEDHVFHDNQLNLLHQDTMRVATELGQEHSFTREDVIRQQERLLNQTKMKDVDFKKYSGALYRNGGKAEDSILRGDFRKAYVHVQGRENAYAMTLGIKKLEKEQAAHARLRSLYRKRDPEGRDSELTPFIHNVLERIGETTRPRTDIETEMAATSFKDMAGLDEFLRSPENDIGIMPSFLRDTSWRRDPEQMTVEEWRGVNDFLHFLDGYSRDNKTITVADRKFQFEETIEKMVDQIVAQSPRLPGTGDTVFTNVPKGKMKELAHIYFVESLHMETMFNWMDKNNPRGIFNQAIIRDFTSAANYADKLDKEAGALLKKLTSIKNPNRLVKQGLFINPDTGERMQFTRKQILGILANMGNPSNFYKLLDSYNIPREMADKVKDLVWANVTREDVSRMTQLGDIFKKYKKMSDTMYRGLYRQAPMNIDLWSIQTPFKELGQNGLVEGWYYPIVHDFNFKQSSPKLAAPSPLEFPVWTKSNLPTANYTKQRTAYTGPVLLDVDGFQATLAMMVKDIAFRPTLMNMNKIFKNPEFRRAVREHWGPHYENLLDPFLQDVSGYRRIDNKNQSILAQSLQFVRQNIVSHMVGLNPATIAKHTTTAALQSMAEVGVGAWAREMAIITGQAFNPFAGERNWTFAMNKSEELQRRHRNAVDGISGNFDRTFGKLKEADVMRDFLHDLTERPLPQSLRLAINGFQGKYLRLRDTMHFYEASPIAFLDLLSAVPTWLARYRQAKIGGENEGNAIFMADRAVRRAHGSSAITSRSALMRNNAIAPLVGNFYTFFSHILQRQTEWAWAARAAMRGDGYYVGPPKAMPDGTIDPPSIAKVKPGRHVEAETEGEYQNTDAYKVSMKMAVPMAGLFVAYYMVPAWVDEWVSPSHDEKGVGPDRNESSLWYASKVQAKGLGGSWLGLRDLVHALTEGGDPSAGMWGEFSKSMYQALKPQTTQRLVGRSSPQDRMKALKTINQGFNALTGVGAPNSIPRMGVFGTGWYYGAERPQNLREFWTGLTHGTAHPRKH